MSSQHRGDSLLRVVLIVLAVIVFAPLLMMLLAMPMMGMMGWWWAGGGLGMGAAPLWGLGLMLLFLLAVLAVGYVLYRGLVGSRTPERNRALEELRSAYARGDFTDEEFEQRRQRLERDRE
ncbi:hypothetical protein HALDL1_04405 [Halobacterium sp. DL1]|jgi:putative membrane protein|nr:hypothetical protein HALDL1_04405 [Halobacterium sp. DL1]